MKDSRCSSSTYTESLFLHVIKHNLLFLLLLFFIWLFFHEYSRFTEQQVKGRLSPYTLSTTSTRFTNTQTLAGLLLQRAHFCAWLAAGIEHGLFGTRSLEFTHSTLALVAAVVSRMLKTRVTLGNISRALLNLTKRLIFAMSTQLTVIFFLQLINYGCFAMFTQLTVKFSLQLINYGCFSS